MKKTYKLNIVAALPCEAESLKEYFQLTKIVRQPTSFPVFTNKCQTIHLVITGVGRVKMAAAVSYLHMLTGQRAIACFLNIGVAGASEFKVGQAVLVNKLIEPVSNSTWYPFTNPLKYPCQGTLYTFDQPQMTYPPMGMVDMEGSGFFQTAKYFVTQEQIQLLKIISDHDTVTQQNVTPQRVVNLIKEHLPSIKIIADYLINLSEKESQLDFDYEELEQFKKTWHFTYAQELELKNYLQRWQNLHLGSAWDACQNEKNARNVIKTLSTNSSLK